MNERCRNGLLLFGINNSSDMPRRMYSTPASTTRVCSVYREMKSYVPCLEVPVIQNSKLLEVLFFAGEEVVELKLATQHI